jgi:hypothetical protein
VQGRWISPDPAGLGAVDPSNPQSWNRYAYVLNNPAVLIDPLGLYWLEACVQVNGGAPECSWTWEDGGDGGGPAQNPGGGTSGGGGGGSGAANNTNCGAMSRFNEVTSRVLAGGSALVNVPLGGIKVLGWLLGAGAAPATGPAAPVVEGVSDYEVWNGFWQAVNGVENGIYAVTGSQQAEHNAQAATTVGTVSGLLVYAATGNVQTAATVGSFENLTSPVDAAATLVDLGGELLTAGSPCTPPAPGKK